MELGYSWSDTYLSSYIKSEYICRWCYCELCGQGVIPPHLHKANKKTGNGFFCKYTHLLFHLANPHKTKSLSFPFSHSTVRSHWNLPSIPWNLFTTPPSPNSADSSAPLRCSLLWVYCLRLGRRCRGCGVDQGCVLLGRSRLIIFFGSVMQSLYHTE